MDDVSPSRKPAEPESAGAALRLAGRVGGPVLALAAYLTLPSGLGDAGRATAAVAVLVAILWMTEALPLAVTALLPLVLFPAAGVMKMREAAAPYANEVIFLFLGGFLLALAMERWGLHRRIALRVLSVVGARPPALLGGFMAATGFLTMWISNTAAAMVMLPIGHSILALAKEKAHRAGAEAEQQDADEENLSKVVLLGIAYSASIGSLATPIGTPPNLFLRAFVERTYGIQLEFGTWMLMGVPLSALLLVAAWWLLLRLHPIRMREVAGGRELIAEETRKQGPASRGEVLVMVVFGCAIAGWTLREPLTRLPGLLEAAPWVGRVDDTMIAIAGAVALFVLPASRRPERYVLDWSVAREVPWGILLLFGGGLSLAAAIQQTGVAAWIAGALHGTASWPLPLLTVAVTAVIIFLTELTSNTATAATFIPLLGGLAAAVGGDPMVLLVPATLAATCAFMLPVATPPNAIVFGRGGLRIADMARAGVWLNLIAIALISAAMLTLGRWALPIVAQAGP